MKAPKINFPKLKNPTICQIVLYSPIILAFIAILFIWIFIDKISAVLPDFFITIIILSLLIFSLIYLFSNLSVFMVSDAYFATVRAYKRDRKYFEFKANGKTRAKAEKAIIRRISRLGYTCTPLTVTPCPLLIKFYSHFSWTAYYARIEKICLLYSVNHLDTTTYYNILKSAKANINPLHGNKSEMFFLDKDKKKAPIISAAAVIILADSLDPTIPQIVRKNISSHKNNAIIPCVADISCGRYYFDAMKEYYLIGMSGKPAKNYAIETIIKAVFGNRLPLRNNDNFCDNEKLDLKKNLWEIVAEYSADKNTEKNKVKIPFIYRIYAKTIKAGQIKFKGSYIFCKIRKKAIAFPYELDKQQQNHLHIKLHKKSVAIFGKNLSKKELETLRLQLSQFLDAENFTYEFKTIS